MVCLMQDSALINSPPQAEVPMATGGDPGLVYSDDICLRNENYILHN